MYTMRMNLRTAYDMVRWYIESRGYRLVGNEIEQSTYLFSVLDCLEGGDEIENYTIDQWFQDCLQNFPEDFVKI